MTDSKSRCVVEISTDTRPIVYLTIDRLSTDYRPTIDRLSTDYRPTVNRLSTDCRPTIDRLSTDYQPTIDRLSTDCRPTIDRLSAAISPAMSTDISVDITHCKQDPGFLPLCKVYQGWGLQQSGPTDPPKESGRKLAPTALIASKFRLGNTR